MGRELTSWCANPASAGLEHHTSLLGIASAHGEGGWVVRRGVDLDCVFTIAIELHSERPKCLACLCLMRCSSSGDVWCGSVWDSLRSGSLSGLSRQSPGDEREESNRAAFQALDIH